LVKVGNLIRILSDAYKEFTIDLKTIYGAVNREAAATALNAFEQKWDSKYRYAINN